MKIENDRRPACLQVTKYGPDSFGTRYIEIAIGVQTEADDTVNGGRYVARPERAIGGVPMPERGRVAARFYSSVRDPQKEISPDLTHLEVTDIRGANLYEAKSFVKSLTAISKRLEAQRKQYGYTYDFAEWTMRVAAALRIKLVAVDWDVYKEATGVGPRYDLGDAPGHYKWIGDMRDARSFFAALARTYVCARCRDCTKPIPDGQEVCYECKRLIAETNCP